MSQLPVLLRKLACISLNSVLTALENMVKKQWERPGNGGPHCQPLQFHRQDFMWATSLTHVKIWGTKSYLLFWKQQGTVRLKRGSYRQPQADVFVSFRWKKCLYQFPFHTAKNHSAVIKLYSTSIELLNKYYLTLEKLGI